MSDSQAQASFEALLLFTLVFIGAVVIISFFFEISDATLAMQLAKITVSEKLQALDKFYYIQRIDFEETSTQSGTGLSLKVFIAPTDHGLTDKNFGAEAAFIASKTKYNSVKIKTS